MISLAPFAISQRLQPPDKGLVSVRGNGIQRPGEFPIICWESVTDKAARRNAIGQRGCKRFLKKKFQLAVYLLIAHGKGVAKACIC